MHVKTANPKSLKRKLAPRFYNFEDGGMSPTDVHLKHISWCKTLEDQIGSKIIKPQPSVFNKIHF
jgi:hypothetical protein